MHTSYPHETHNPSPVRDSVKDPPNLPYFNVGLQSDKFRLNPDTNPFIPNQRLNINHENDCPESTNSITDNNPDHSTISDLRRLRLSNPNRIIIRHLNINSLRNKFNDLKFLVSQYIDILILSETKIDATFPTSQFIIPGFCIPYRFDRTRFGGGIMVYVREGIPNKLLKGQTQSNIINICLELNLKGRK